ncbi:MAG: restriction endonuclease subunit S [Alistipes sp.]|nr:restriction endonuclease subunit S [Alistipes sp.]
MMQNNEIRWVRLGDYIEPYRKKCGDTEALVSGVDINKQFISTRANMEGVDVSKYYLVPPKYFACNLMHIGRDERLPIAYNSTDENLVVTSAYYVFKIKDCKLSEVTGEYLSIYFQLSEVDRLTWFYTDSSVRGNLPESRFVDIEFLLPSPEKQRELVATWKGLRDMKEQNEAMAAPLMQLCQSRLQELKHKYPLTEIGPYIEQCDERNSDKQYGVDSVMGVSIGKKFISTKADMTGVSLTPYKLVKPNEFCFVTVTSRNGGKISLALNQSDDTYIVSSSYEVFRVIDEEKVCPGFLYLWFCQSEFDRYARFHSWGSARETFSYESMERVEVPLPSIKEQQAIVNIYKCAAECKRIADEADRLSREICPALMQKAIRG